MSLAELHNDLANLKHETVRQEWYSREDKCGCPLTELAIQQKLITRREASFRGASNTIFGPLMHHYNVVFNDLTKIVHIIDTNFNVGLPELFGPTK